MKTISSALDRFNELMGQDAVLSDQYKDRLRVLANSIALEAYERGKKAGRGEVYRNWGGGPGRSATDASKPGEQP